MCANQVPPLVPHVILWLRLQWPVLHILEASSDSGHFAGLSRHFAWFQKQALDSSLLFPIRVQVSLFSVLRSLSLFADSVLPALGRRFNLSRSALPHSLRTVVWIDNQPLWHLHCHVERRVLTVGGNFAALCVTPVMNMFLDRGFAIVVFFPAEVHGSVLRVARRSSHLGRWLEGLWGIFEDVRFYPIMNFGHFWALPSSRCPGFTPPGILANFWPIPLFQPLGTLFWPKRRATILNFYPTRNFGHF